MEQNRQRRERVISEGAGLLSCPYVTDKRGGRIACAEENNGMHSKRVKVEDATPGMKLAKGVTNASGLTVLMPGNELDEELIERMQRMGIATIHIELPPGDPNVGPSLSEMEAALDARFRLVVGSRFHATVQDIIRACYRKQYGVEESSQGRVTT